MEGRTMGRARMRPSCGPPPSSALKVLCSQYIRMFSHHFELDLLSYFQDAELLHCCHVELKRK